ncbi:MAG TPA: hypothetical protein VFI53_14860 [Myxococcaceae bacterium]|nr:hypothetical protein [Myxococcaceae bacterium]
MAAPSALPVLLLALLGYAVLGATLVLLGLAFVLLFKLLLTGRLTVVAAQNTSRLKDIARVCGQVCRDCEAACKPHRPPRHLPALHGGVPHLRGRLREDRGLRIAGLSAAPSALARPSRGVWHFELHLDLDRGAGTVPAQV